MNSVMRFIVWGTIPIGALLGGVLGTWVGLRETIIIGAIGGSLAVLWIVFSPQRHLREMPEPIAEEEEPLQTEAGATVPGVVDPWAPVGRDALLMRFWPRGGLWRHPDFLKLWSAETISQLGRRWTISRSASSRSSPSTVSAFEVAVLGPSSSSRSSCSRCLRESGSTGCADGRS